MEELGTYAENTWCRGCGNFGILSVFKKAIIELEERGTKRENIAISAGIGCHAKIFDYLNLSGLYSLHGRDIATVQGIKIANPELKVVTFSGDGNAMGEGLAHTIFAAKRNADMTLLLHNNGVYALTTGQFTPLSEKGWIGPSTPKGSIEEPFNPLSLILESGATFVARGFPGKAKHLVNLIVQAIEHEGFSFVEILQPAVAYRDTWDFYRENIEILDTEPKNYEEAIKIAKRRDKLPIGVIYRVKKPVFHKELYGDWNPIINRLTRQKRIEKVQALLKQD
ncbi:MAG: thiamine pyrophosphate-dependent enzyme [Candidatus Thorarchaeota archaeon]